MKPFKIVKNTNGDSRVATHVPTYSDFITANLQHIEAVGNMMSQFSKDIFIRSKDHDWTKRKEPYRSMFYVDLCNAINKTAEFNDGEWAKVHYKKERHHLLKNVPEDVNLIDVIEMIADCVCAGMARSGEVRPLEISDEVLKKAVENTVKLMQENIILVDKLDEEDVEKEEDKNE